MVAGWPMADEDDGDDGEDQENEDEDTNMYRQELGSTLTLGESILQSMSYDLYSAFATCLDLMHE